MNDNTPPSAHAVSISVGDPAIPATRAGVWKMPAPITMPTVIMMASKTLSAGAGTSSLAGDDACDVTGSRGAGTPMNEVQVRLPT